MKKIIFSILIFFSFVSAQMPDPELYAIVSQIQMNLKSNGENLSSLLKAGKEAVTEIEKFAVDKKIDSEKKMKDWVEIYVYFYYYVHENSKQLDSFYAKALKNNYIPKKFLSNFKSTFKDYKSRYEMKVLLNVGNKFPELPKSTKDTNGKAISMKQYDKKVVLVDFWATWCGPCLQELPNVKAAYKKYKNKGFDILGISFDGPDKAAFNDFIEEKDMPWRQIYDGKHWESELSDYFNIKAIPATYLLKNGVIVAKNLRGPQLEAKLAELLD